MLRTSTTIALLACFGSFSIQGMNNNSNAIISDAKQEIYTQNQKVPNEVLNSIYFACQMGNLEKIDTLSRIYGPEIFNLQVYNRSGTPGLSMEIAIQNKQWDVAFKLMELKIDITSHASDSEKNWILYETVNTNDQSEKKRLFLDALISKKISINSCTSPVWGYYNSPLHQYIWNNHVSIKHDDSILKWFLEKKVDIVGTKIINTVYLNNIFHNIIDGCNHSSIDVMRITKTACNILLQPVTHKLFTFFCSKAIFDKKNSPSKLVTPLRLLIANLCIKDAPVTETIINALKQQVENNLPIMQSLPETLYTSEQKKLFDPNRWQKEPLKQYLFCVSSQNK